MTSGLKWLFVNFLHSFDKFTYALENGENKTKQNKIQLLKQSFFYHLFSDMLINIIHGKKEKNEHPCMDISSRFW